MDKTSSFALSLAILKSSKSPDNSSSSLSAFLLSFNCLSIVFSPVVVLAEADLPLLSSSPSLRGIFPTSPPLPWSSEGGGEEGGDPSPLSLFYPFFFFFFFFLI